MVILVDEYDKPLLQVLEDKPLLDEYRRILKAFYGVEKTMDAYIQFGLFSGVTKFSKVSVFSDLNNRQTFHSTYAMPHSAASPRNRYTINSVRPSHS